MPALVPQRPLLQLRGVALDPAVQRRVVDGDAAFAHHLLEVPVADAVAAVPAHAQEDHLAGKVPPLELAAHCQLRRSSARRQRSSPRRFLQRSPPDGVHVFGPLPNGHSVWDFHGPAFSAQPAPSFPMAPRELLPQSQLTLRLIRRCPDLGCDLLRSALRSTFMVFSIRHNILQRIDLGDAVLTSTGRGASCRLASQLVDLLGVLEDCVSILAEMSLVSTPASEPRRGAVDPLPRLRPAAARRAGAAG